MGLEELQALLSSWGCKAGNVVDLKRISDLLVSYDELTVSEFSRRVEIALTGEGGGVRARANRTSKKVDEDKVGEYIERLTAPGLDRLGYMPIFSELRADKKVRGAELSIIANRLTHSDSKYRNKSDAISSMEAWVNCKFDTERRLSGTAGIF